MAEISAPNLMVIGLFGTLSLAFLSFRTYKFDAFQCLIPRRKDCFRCLLVWMLLISNRASIAWAGGWLYVKTQLGMVRFGSTGARPWPSALFPERFQSFNAPLTVLFGLSYGLQAALNAHEGLFWWYRQRSTRSPQAVKPFTKSASFYLWIAMTIVIMAVQQSIPWINHDGGLEVQLSKELLAGGIIEMIVLLASTIVVLKFPRLLKDVEALGAAPAVRVRLYRYHQLNIVRTLLRFTFSVPLIIFGADGMTKAMLVNNSPLASDFLATLIGGSLALVMMISIVLYLPRDSAHVEPKDDKCGFALMSLLREGGQWEGEHDFGGGENEKGQFGNDAPFANARVRVSSWNGEEADGEQVPRVLADFTSPIAISTEQQPQGPIRIQMKVERDVHRDSGGSWAVASPVERGSGGKVLRG